MSLTLTEGKRIYREVCKESTQWNKNMENLCPSEKKVADLGNRGASVEKLEKGNWFEGPSWLLDEENWPQQLVLKSLKKSNEEAKPMKEIAEMQ